MLRRLPTCLLRSCFSSPRSPPHLPGIEQWTGEHLAEHSPPRCAASTPVSERGLEYRRISSVTASLTALPPQPSQALLRTKPFLRFPFPAPQSRSSGETACGRGLTGINTTFAEGLSLAPSRRRGSRITIHHFLISFLSLVWISLTQDVLFFNDVPYGIISKNKNNNFTAKWKHWLLAGACSRMARVPRGRPRGRRGLMGSELQPRELL